jgi:DNA polymerase III alpha subunit
MAIDSVCVCCGIEPATISEAPNPPMARAKASSPPARMPGQASGRVRRRNTDSRDWRSVLAAARLAHQPNGRFVRACGLVTTRQQPATAKGTVFVTLEDETGCVNVIVWKDLRDAQRQVLLGARLMAVDGVWQCQGGVRHLLARRLIDVSRKLGSLPVASRNFR